MSSIFSYSCEHVPLAHMQVYGHVHACVHTEAYTHGWGITVTLKTHRKGLQNITLGKGKPRQTAYMPVSSTRTIEIGEYFSKIVTMTSIGQ